MSLMLSEHRVLLRQWGRLQTQIDALLKEQTRQRAQWASEVMRLRAELIIRDTQAYWGMGAVRLLPRSVPRRELATATTAAQVICQSGCVSQAHAWLGSDDQCRLYGGECDQVSMAGPSPHSPPKGGALALASGGGPF